MEYCEVRKIAKDTIEYIKKEISAGMRLTDALRLCEENIPEPVYVNTTYVRSEKNVDMLRKRLTFQTVGPDKINMLRHALKFPTYQSMLDQMKKHAEIIRPKFETILTAFENELGGKGIASWTNPRGGYFISLFVMPGCAKRGHALCKEAGLVLTGAGASYPYGKDPRDSHLRIAPTYPTPENLKTASAVLCTAVKLAALEKLTGM